MMGFGYVGVGNGGSSSSFSNLSPLAPPFTLDRSVTKPISSPLVDMTEPSFGVSMNSSLHNWLPPAPQTSGLDFFANPSSEFDWLSFSSVSQAAEHSDNPGPLLGHFSISATDASLYGDCSDTLTNSIGKAKPYYPSYASTNSLNQGCPLVIVDQPSYDWLSNSHVATFDVHSCQNYSHGASVSERSVEEASHSIDMPGLNKCSDFVREQLNEESLLERAPIVPPVENLRISNMDAYSAFPGCHPKTKTSPLNLATSSQNSSFMQNTPYQEVLSQQDARLSEATSIFNSTATFSSRPPVVSTDSFAWNTGPCKNSQYSYDFTEAKQGGNNLLNVKEILPFSSESKVYSDTEKHGTCIDKNDPVITEFLPTKIQDLPKNICVVNDTSDPTLKAEVGYHIPDVSPHLTLDRRTIETATAMESSSESFDQYNLAVDSPCWRGAPVSRISPFEASDIAVPHHVKKVETCNGMNLSFPEIPYHTADDIMKIFVPEPIESTIDIRLEKGTAYSPEMLSVASALPAELKTSNSVKAEDACSKIGRFYPAPTTDHEPVGDDSNSVTFHTVPKSNQNNLKAGRKTASTNCMEKHADAGLNGGDSSDYGLSHLSYGAAEHLQNFPSCMEDGPSKLTKFYHGESISKFDIQVLVDAMQNLSELLLAYSMNGLRVLHQKDVKSLQSVMSNLETCIINSVGPQDSLSPEQRTSQNLRQLYRDVRVPKSQMTETEVENVECPLNDRYGVEKKNQHILSVKKDDSAADSLSIKNGIDLRKEDNMTLVSALKKVLSENFHDEEGEHPQSSLYKNLWLEAEAALCAFNFRSRFDRAKLELEKHVLTRYERDAKNKDEQRLSDVSPGPSTAEKLASEAEVSPSTFISVQTSTATSASSYTDMVTRFHILKCRDDETKPRIVENLDELSGSKVSVEQDMVEKTALDEKITAIPDIKDMNPPPFPTSKVMENDSGASLAPASPILTSSSYTDDDVLSRFQILKSRDERMNPVEEQRISSFNCSKVDDTIEAEIDAIIGPGNSKRYPHNADNEHEADNIDASVMAGQNALSRGSWTPAGEQLPEFQRDDWPKNVKRGVLSVEMEALLRPEHGKGGRNFVADKFPAGCSDGSASDWEHVLWGE